MFKSIVLFLALATTLLAGGPGPVTPPKTTALQNWLSLSNLFASSGWGSSLVLHSDGKFMAEPTAPTALQTWLSISNLFATNGLGSALVLHSDGTFLAEPTALQTWLSISNLFATNGLGSALVLHSDGTFLAEPTALQTWLSISNLFATNGLGSALVLHSDGIFKAETVFDGRPRITNLTYYVSTTGNDTNDGLALGTAFASGQHAANVAMRSWDFGTNLVTIQFADGLYYGSITVSGVVGNTDWQLNGGALVIQGNTTNADKVLLVGTNTTHVICASGKAAVTVNHLTLTATNADNGNLINSQASSWLRYNDIVFSNAPASHVAVESAAVLSALGTNTITGPASVHWYALAGGSLWASGTNTIVGTPKFTNAFAIAETGGSMMLSATFSGSATGIRWITQYGGSIIPTDLTATYLPGNSAGVDILNHYPNGTPIVNGTNSVRKLEAVGTTGSTYISIRNNNAPSGLSFGVDSAGQAVVNLTETNRFKIQNAGTERIGLEIDGSLNLGGVNWTVGTTSAPTFTAGNGSLYLSTLGELWLRATNWTRVK